MALPRFDLSTLDGKTGSTFLGVTAGDRAGQAVSGAGDVNGDGRADILIGAPGGDPGGRLDAGKASLVFGQDWLGAGGEDSGSDGSGDQSLKGTAGADRFVFWAAAHSALGAGDAIRDFASGIDKIVFKKLGSGRFIGEAAFTAGDGIEARFDGARDQLQVDANDNRRFDAGDLEIDGLSLVGERDVLFL